jgi:hypothetical protein
VPYADPSEQARFSRELYLRKYQSDPEFREAEALRKKQWYYRNQAKILARYRKKRKKIRASSQVVNSGRSIHAVELGLFTTMERVPVLF